MSLSLRRYILVVYNSCSATLQLYINMIDDPKMMRDTLGKQLYTAKIAIGWQAIFHPSFFPILKGAVRLNDYKRTNTHEP